VRKNYTKAVDFAESLFIFLCASLSIVIMVHKDTNSSYR